MWLWPERPPLVTPTLTLVFIPLCWFKEVTLKDKHDKRRSCLCQKCSEGSLPRGRHHLSNDIFSLHHVHFLVAGKWYSPWLVLKGCVFLMPAYALLVRTWFIQVSSSYSSPVSALENEIFYSLHSKPQQSCAAKQENWLVSVCRVKAPSPCGSHLREDAGCFGTGMIRVLPRRLSWNLQIPPCKRRNIYKPPIFAFHVSFQGICALDCSWIVWMTVNVSVLVFSSHTFTYSLDSGRAREATVDKRHHRPRWAHGVWSKELRRGFTSSGGKEISNWLCCRETTTGCRSSCYSERLGQQYCVVLLALVSCWPQGFF